MDLLIFGVMAILFIFILFSKGGNKEKKYLISLSGISIIVYFLTMFSFTKCASIL